MSNKQCFCIDANSKEMPAIIEALKREEKESKEKHVTKDKQENMDYDLIKHADCNADYLLTPHLGDVYKNDKEIINNLSKLVHNAVVELDSVRAANDLHIANRDSMTIEPSSNFEPSSNVEPSLDDDVNLNTMANLMPDYRNGDYRDTENMGLFEDFTCNSVCGKKENVRIVGPF